jgi:peptidoglycan/xylan/chitin deacetylase (PgdA/CDA1 family)
MLYYVGEIEQLQTACKKLFDALAPGGCLLTAHANLLVDDPRACGFDWEMAFGAKKICETFLQFPPLRLLKELRTPLYRIQLFQRDSKLRELLPKSLRCVGANQIISAKHAAPDALVAAHIKWQGGAPRSRFELEVTTEHLSILMYHRVARAGSAAMSRWRVTPEAFEEQLAYLRDSHYYSISLRAWNSAREQRKLLPGRPVLITFDDGYQDFLSEAWPLLKRYGFGATVFLVTEAVGLSNVWDSAYGETIPLLDWAGIRQLRSEGVEFGSHTATHRPLTGLSHEEVVREAVRSRAAIARELADIVDTISYPHGEFDPSIQHLVGAAGYVFGLSCRPGRCRFRDPLLALPRIDILGTDNLEDFVSKLSSYTSRGFR